MQLTCNLDSCSLRQDWTDWELRFVVIVGGVLHLAAIFSGCSIWSLESKRSIWEHNKPVDVYRFLFSFICCDDFFAVAKPFGGEHLMSASLRPPLYLLFQQRSESGVDGVRFVLFIILQEGLLRIELLLVCFNDRQPIFIFCVGIFLVILRIFICFIRVNIKVRPPQLRLQLGIDIEWDVTVEVDRWGLDCGAS